MHVGIWNNYNSYGHLCWLDYEGLMQKICPPMGLYDNPGLNSKMKKVTITNFLSIQE